MLGNFEFSVLLAVYSVEGDVYGVSIKNYIDNEFSKNTSYGAMYTTLSRLNKKGFVESWEGEATAVRGGRSKKLYKITPKGLSALRQTTHKMQALISTGGLANVLA